MAANRLSIQAQRQIRITTSRLAEKASQIQNALHSIAEEFRQPLVLREIDEMSYDEIATALEIPVGTVRSRIFRARQELSDRLKRLFPEEH